MPSCDHHPEAKLYAAGLIAVVTKARGVPYPVTAWECPACGLAFGTLMVIGLAPPQDANDDAEAKAWDDLNACVGGEFVHSPGCGFRNHGARIRAKACGAQCLACGMGLRGVPVGRMVWCSIVRKFSTSAHGGRRWRSK